MQNDPEKRLAWQEMQKHEFFTATEKTMIPFNIVFDEDPPEGILFKNNKIYVSTRNPDAYTKLHKAAIDRYKEDQDEILEDHLNDMLVSNDNVQKLFPRLSKDLNISRRPSQVNEEVKESLLVRKPTNDKASKTKEIVDDIMKFDKDGLPDFGGKKNPDSVLSTQTIGGKP